MNIRWGILGTGGIASKFAESFRYTHGGELFAVASRSQEKANLFAKRHGIPHAFGSYREFADSQQVDAVYIATPHPMHFENAAMCLQEGNHVLCEKPVTMNADQFEKLTELAQHNGCFFMEAIWSRFIPVFCRVNQWLHHELNGEAEYLRADFGMYKPLDPESRLFNPHLGGGSLLDVGFYPVWLAIHVFNAEPESIHAEANFTETGVDNLVTMTLTFPGNRKADLMCANQLGTPTRAEIYGNGFRIEMDPQFHCPTRASLTKGDETSVFQTGFDPHGYQFETTEANRCIAESLPESPHLPWHRSLQIMRTLDRIRNEIDLRYPENLESTELH